jgi:hypothetical protein
VLAPTATKHLSDKCFSDFPIRAELLKGIPFDRATEGPFDLPPVCRRMSTGVELLGGVWGGAYTVQTALILFEDA